LLVTLFSHKHIGISLEYLYKIRLALEAV